MNRRIIKIIIIALALFSFVEIICINFSIGLKWLDQNWQNVILNLSYAYFGSFIFYIVVNVIPDSRKKVFVNKIVKKRVNSTIKAINKIIEKVNSDSNSDCTTGLEQCIASLQNIDPFPKISYEINNIAYAKAQISEMYSVAYLLDPEEIYIIDELDTMLINFSFGQCIEGETIDQTVGNKLWKIIILKQKLEKIFA